MTQRGRRLRSMSTMAQGGLYFPSAVILITASFVILFHGSGAMQLIGASGNSMYHPPPLHCTTLRYVRSPSPMRSHGLLSTVLMPSMTTRSLFPPGPFHHMLLARFLTESHCVPSWLDSLFRRSLRCDIALVTRWNANTVLSCIGLAKNNISRPTDSGSKMSGPLDPR